MIHNVVGFDIYGRALIIIKMPKSKETQETPSIGITYDEKFNFIIK